MQVVTVVAPAGTGKSRLLQEFVSRSNVRALRGRCLSYGEGLTFWPLAEIARTEAGIENDDPAAEAQRKLAELLGEDARRRRTDRRRDRPVPRPTRSRRRSGRPGGSSRSSLDGEPLIVLIDDIHWAERTFLDLIDSVASTLTDAPSSSRVRRGPTSSTPIPTGAHLRPPHVARPAAPLGRGQRPRSPRTSWATADLDERVRAKIVEAAEGNPLFVEQMLSMLLDDGILGRDERGRWILIRDVGAITIPPTIQALLSARLDRLGPIDRVVLERAAVIGQVFFRGAVEDLSPDEVRRHAGESLQTLTNRELVTPHESSFAGQEAYRFMHILIRRPRTTVC